MRLPAARRSAFAATADRCLRRPARSPGSGSAIAGRRPSTVPGSQEATARDAILRKPRHRCRRWCRRHRPGRRLRPTPGLGPAGRWPRNRPAEAMGWLRVEIHIGRSHESPQRQVVQAVSGTVKLLADLVTDLLDLLRLQHLDDPGNWVSRGPGLPGKDSPAVRDSHARLIIRLLGDNNCRAVKKRDLRRKNRHGKAAFPPLVSRIAVSHSCPPVLSTPDRHAGRPRAHEAQLSSRTCGANDAAPDTSRGSRQLAFTVLVSGEQRSMRRLSPVLWEWLR